MEWRGEAGRRSTLCIWIGPHVGEVRARRESFPWSRARLPGRDRCRRRGEAGQNPTGNQCQTGRHGWGDAACRGRKTDRGAQQASAYATPSTKRCVG